MFDKRKFKSALLSINEVLQYHKQNFRQTRIEDETTLLVSIVNEVDTMVHNATVESEHHARVSYRKGYSDATDEGLKSHSTLMAEQRDKHSRIVKDLLFAGGNNALDSKTAKFWVERREQIAESIKDNVNKSPKIAVIKEIRQTYSLGLKDSKDYYEFLFGLD